MNEYVMVFNHKISFITRAPDPVSGKINPNLIGRTRINDPDHPGKKKPKDFSGHSREEIIANAYHYFRKTELNSALPGVPLIFDEWADRTFNLLFQYHEITTIKAEKRSLNYLKERLHGIYLPLLTTAKIQSVMDELSQKYAASAVHKTKSLLKRMLDTAVNDGILAVNPAKNVIVPKIVINHNQILRTEEIVLLLRECGKDRYGIIIILCLLCAFRIGECLGLTEDEIHEDRGTILITHQYRSETHSFEKPKNKKDHLIYPPPIAFEFIKRQRRITEQLSIVYSKCWHNDRNLLFTDFHGGPITEVTVEAHFKVIAEKIGRPELHLHDLRRSSASIAMYLTNNPKDVQELLGHSTMGMSFYYIDTLPEQKEAFASDQNVYYSDLVAKSKIKATIN